MEYDYKKDIQIDEFNLDKEWIIHSQLYMKWLEYSVMCSNILDKKKEQLEVFEATLDQFIRKNAGDKKLTEASIKNEIITNQEYQKLKQEVIEANYNYNIAKSAVSAFEHRKKALEKLCDLYIFGYNSNPKQNIKENIINNIQEKIKGGLK